MADVVNSDTGDPLMSTEMTTEEYFRIVYSVNVNKYKLVDCPSCGIMGKFCAITNDERNEFLHGTSRTLPMMLSVFGDIAQSVVKKGVWGTAAGVASAILDQETPLLRFMRCAACRSVILVCPHCGKLMAGIYYHGNANAGNLRCPHCANQAQG